jgi:hypothetical protein
MKIDNQLSTDELSEAMAVLVSKRKSDFQKTSTVVAAVCGWVGFMILFSSSRVYELTATSALLLLFAVVFSTEAFSLLFEYNWFYKAFLRLQYSGKNLGRILGPNELEISEDGLRMKTNVSEGVLKWEGFKEALESKRYFFLRIHDLTAIAIPKFKLDGGDQSPFLIELRKRLSPQQRPT